MANENFFSLQGQVAVVTGAGQGIGEGIATRLGQAGARVAILDTNRAAAEEVALRLKGVGLHCDVSSAPSVKQAIEEVQRQLGPIQILVNNAGIAGGTFPGEGPEHRAADVPMDLLRKVFETNFFAQVELTEKLLPLIRKSPAGRIVNLSSILASLKLHADPNSPIYNAKSFAYDASKTALNALTVHLAYELRDTNIKVNSAHPGWVKTDMGGQSAPMELNEGAKTSAALATLAEDGPTGGFFHMGKPLPW